MIPYGILLTLWLTPTKLLVFNILVRDSTSKTYELDLLPNYYLGGMIEAFSKTETTCPEASDFPKKKKTKII